MARQKKEKPQEPLEKQLWAAADKLRKNIDAAEYKHVVLGLIFLRYISDSFEELYEKLKNQDPGFENADPEDKVEYGAQNVFFVPPEARWSYLRDNAKKAEIGVMVDAALDAIEKENPTLKGVLPRVYARENLDPASLGALIDLVSGIALNDAKARSADVLGHVFEYFLGEFALAEGKKGGQFYTPLSIVELLVSMLEPFRGRVMDPCCGSGGMFVQSERFVDTHKGMRQDLSIFGQESNQTTWRLCRMNLAIRNIDSSQIKWNNEGSFLNDAHKDIRADYILANPPFNDSDWSGELLRKDARNMGALINRRTRILTPEDIKTISETYHNWRNVGGEYQDVKGFCASVPLSEVAAKDYVLTPGRYVGLPDEEDDFDFAERFASLQKEFAEQLEEEKRLNEAILESLGKLKI